MSTRPYDAPMDIDWSELARQECACGDVASMRHDQVFSVGLYEHHSWWLCLDYGHVRARRVPAHLLN